MNMKNTLLGVSVALLLLGTASVALAAFTYSHVITLEPGWNTISTPRVLDSHLFSAAQISANFDIYVLDASQPSGWATMAAVGQTEFQPLYGYFINNKTGVIQTLTLRYKDGLTPAQRLFSRSISSTGWNSIGVANPTYAIKRCEDATNTDNAADVLYSLDGKISAVVDFTTGEYDSDPASVFVSDTWTNATPGNLNTLNDLRDTKGYAVYVTASALYAGSQDQDDLDDCPPPPPPGDVELNLDEASDNPEARVVDVDDESATDYVVLLTGDLEASGDDIEVQELTVTLDSTGADVDIIADTVSLEVDGDVVQTLSTSTDCSGGMSSVCVFDDVDASINRDDSVKIRILVDVNGTDDIGLEGSTLTATIDNGDTVAEDSVSNALTSGDLLGAANGHEHAFYSEGIQVEFVSASESKVTSDGEPDLGTYVVRFNVTAFDTDVFIDGDSIDCAENATPPIPPAVSDQGVIYGLTGSHTGTSNCDFATSGGQTVNSNYEVNDGESHTFTLTVSVEGDDDFVSVALESINWATTDLVAPDQFYTFNLDEFETDALYLSSL